MVESKLSRVKVNNEIELCEVYDSGRYIICVNKSQETLARNSIMRVVPDYRDRVSFYDGTGKKEGGRSPFWSLIAQIE